MIIRRGVGSWAGFIDYVNPFKATQPNYVPAKAPGPVVPTGALDPSTGYHPYASDYTWCSPTDVDCLNGITNRPDNNIGDARRNMQVYTAAQLAAIKQAEDDAAANDKQNWAMWGALAVIGIGGAYVLTSRGGRR